MKSQRMESTVKVNILDLSSLEENAINFINTNVVKDGDLAVSANAYGGTHGIVETDEGTYYLCSEGVGMDTPVTNDNPIVLEFHYNTESGGMSIFPACSKKLTIDKIDEVIYSGLNISNIDFNTGYSKDETIELLSVGRPHWIKGYTTMIQVCKELANRNLDFNYTIIGANKNSEELLYLISQNNLSDRVHLKSKISQEEVFQLMIVQKQ